MSSKRGAESPSDERSSTRLRTLSPEQVDDGNGGKLDVTEAPFLTPTDMFPVKCTCDGPKACSTANCTCNKNGAGCSESCTCGSCANFLNDLPAFFGREGMRASLCFVKYLRSLRGPPLPNAVNLLSPKFQDALRCHLMEVPFGDPSAVSRSFGFSGGAGGKLEGFGERWREAETEDEKDALRKELFCRGLGRDEESWEQHDYHFSCCWTYWVPDHWIQHCEHCDECMDKDIRKQWHCTKCSRCRMGFQTRCIGCGGVSRKYCAGTEEELDVNEDEDFYADNGPYHDLGVEETEPDIEYEYSL